MTASGPDTTADREAQFLRVLEAHGQALRRLAASYEREPARREDLVQDIHLALWRALPAFRGGASERTFVFRVAHNRAVTHVVRARHSSADALDADAPLPDPGADPERAASQAQRRQHLQAAILDLPLGLRQVIVLALEDLTPREIAEVLGLSENNVAVRLTRARQALRRRLAVA